MKFLKDNLSDDSNYLPLDNQWNLIYSIDKKRFLSISLLLKVIIACIYAFGLGYSLYFLNNPIKIGLLFVALLIAGYIFIIIPHELLHILCYPSCNNVIIRYSIFKLKFTSYTDDIISKNWALISLIIPFIIFSIIPSILIYLFDFNLVLYAIASANAIKCGNDLLNFIFIIKNVQSQEPLKIVKTGIYFKSSRNESVSI